MFCKYCGSPVPEGGVCSCQGQPLHQQPCPGQAINQQAPKTPAIDSNKIVSAFAVYFTAPLDTLRAAYAAPEPIGNLLIGAPYLLFVFLFPLIRLLNMKLYGHSLVSGGRAFGTAIVVFLLAAVCKALQAGAAYLISDKSKSYLSALGVFCVAAIPQTILYVLLTLLSLIRILASYGPILGLLAFLIPVTAVTNFTAAMAIMGEDARRKNQMLWVQMAVMFIILLIAGLVLKNCLVGIIKNMDYLF